jgi:hypothetical protein
MDTETACELVNRRLVFGPGWSFTATDATHLHGGTIHVHAAYPAVETAKSDAEQGYPVEVTGRAGFFVTVEPLGDLAGLAAALLARVIMPVYEHEARELLRFLPSYDAPLHPHTVEGRERWGQPCADALFGYPVFCPDGPARQNPTLVGSELGS